MGAGDAAAAQRVDRQLRDHLGLGPRHEHAGADAQLEMAERRDAGDVLQRLARRAPRDEGVEPRGDPASSGVAAHRGGLDAPRGRCRARARRGARHRPAASGTPASREALGGAAEGIGEREGGAGDGRHGRHPA